MYIIVWAAHLLVFSAVCDKVGRASTWVETARIRSQGYVDCMSKNVVDFLTGSLVLWPCHWPPRPLLEELFCSQLMQVSIRVSRYLPRSTVPRRSAAARALLDARGVRWTRQVNSKRRRGSTHEAARSLPVWLRRGRQSILEQNCKCCFPKISAGTHHRDARYGILDGGVVVYAVVSARL